MQNGHVESFNGRLRDECLNAHWFQNLRDARAKISAWRKEYDGEWPHSSLGYRTPNEFAAVLESSVIPAEKTEAGQLISQVGGHRIAGELDISTPEQCANTEEAIRAQIGPNSPKRYQM